MNFADITKNKTVVLLGRGPTARYYKKKKMILLLDIIMILKLTKRLTQFLKAAKFI